jgi:starch synthase
LVQDVKALFLAAEATPFIKVGGLGDVAGELPPALHELGVDIRLALPLHPQIDRSSLDLEPVAAFDLPHSTQTRQALVYLSKKHTVPTYFIDGEPVRRAARVYEDASGDAEKFTFFSLATLAAFQELGWQPDILHANDWHTAPAIQWLGTSRRSDRFWRHTATLLVVHNLPYMGTGAEPTLAAYGLAPSTDERLPEWARKLPLPGGLAAADWLGAVSPTYAAEIQTSEFGCGLEGFLRARSERIVGILNGLDVHSWDPASDQALGMPFSVETLKDRRQGKQALGPDIGLSLDDRIPLLSMITRLDNQKGVDIALDALRTILHLEWQFVLVGTGDPRIETEAHDFGREHRDRVAFIDRFDPLLARRVYGGADMILLPSRYEPCGLAQMIGMRYGCVPIVRATGGLKDSVVDYSAGAHGLGFVFQEASPAALADAILRALQTYKDRRRWAGLQRRGMKRDFSWARSAKRYLEIYRQAVGGKSL